MPQSIWIAKKRVIGLGIAATAVLGAVSLVLVDVLRHHTDVGPAQRLALLGCAALVLVGLSVAILGIDPASPASASPESAKPAVNWLRRVLLGLAALLMVFHLFVYVVYAVSLASFPFDYDQGEGFELNDTVLLSQGQWPYRANEIYPFYASNYPPLYHVLLVPFVWLFGPQYWYGRLAGFAATLITAAAIAYAVRRATRHRLIASLSGLAYLASNYIYHIGPLFRQHITMVLFETLAVVVLAGIDFEALRNPGPRRRKQQTLLLIGLALLLAAGYTKQLAIATVIAAFAYLLLNVPRRALAWGAGFAALAGGLFVLINVSTSGQWWLNIITANVNEYIVAQFRGLLTQFISLHGALLVMAVLMAAYELYFDHLSLYSLWFGAAAIDAVLAGKWGAGDSYYATAIAAMCILAGIFAGRTLNRSWQFPPALVERVQRRIKMPAWVYPALSTLVMVLFIAYGLAVIHIPLGGVISGPVFEPLVHTLNEHAKVTPKFMTFYDSAGWTMGYATIGQIPTAQDVANGWRIVQAVQGDPRPILSEEAAFSFHTGKPVISNPTQLLNLYQNGHYDPAALVAMIDAQKFSAVIFRAGFYPEPVLAAVKRAYVGQQEIDMNGYQYTILVPRLRLTVRLESGAS